MPFGTAISHIASGFDGSLHVRQRVVPLIGRVAGLRSRICAVLSTFHPYVCPLPRSP